MTEYFTYNTSPKTVVKPSPGPLATKETFDKMLDAKRRNGDDYWTVMQEAFAEDLQNLPFDRFKVWASTMMVPFMVKRVFAPYVVNSMLAASKHPEVLEALIEPMVGLTREDYEQHYKVFEDIPVSMNRIQHVAHLCFTDWVGKIQDLDTIVELGAGIGEMADVVRKMGFKGKYVIYDFPVLLEIQKRHHEQLGLENIEYVSDVNELGAADLCIATWSLTEMPLDLREKIIGQIGETKNWLIAYSNQIFGIDNYKYIAEDFVPRFKEHEIEYTDIPFMPWDGGSKYLSVKHTSKIQRNTPNI